MKKFFEIKKKRRFRSFLFWFLAEKGFFLTIFRQKRSIVLLNARFFFASLFFHFLNISRRFRRRPVDQIVNHDGRVKIGLKQLPRNLSTIFASTWRRKNRNWDYSFLRAVDRQQNRVAELRFQKVALNQTQVMHRYHSGVRRNQGEGLPSLGNSRKHLLMVKTGTKNEKEATK